jgi:integrase
MDAYVQHLAADQSLTVKALGASLTWLSAVLQCARHSGLGERHGLPSAFVVLDKHYPKIPTPVQFERGLPDATFRFLLGYDDLLGSRVLDLFRAAAEDAFLGQMRLAALHLGANFGRRPEELCSLKADRVRRTRNGAVLIYDNFKSGRDKVPLPIDGRSADYVSDYLRLVRQRYPQTALKSLALFPARHRNPDGTESLSVSVLGDWFRSWILLLEQAILLAHLRAAGKRPVADFCRVRLGDFESRSGTLTVGGDRIALPSDVSQMLVDYIADHKPRNLRSKYAPVHSRDLLLFPDPVGREDRRRGWRPVPPGRFDALGDDWERIAAQYPCGGVPGLDLGERRISPYDVQFRLFRHTYLQHLVNAGVDIMIVQELADHASVQTTIDSYVRAQNGKLREAEERLSAYRITITGQRAPRSLPIVSRSAADVGTNDCTNPQVLNLGKEGCDRDLMCFRCEFLASDPSHVEDIKARIRTCDMSLARLDADEDDDFKPHHVAVLRHQRDGWARMLKVLQNFLDSLNPAERERVDTAVVIVREIRNRFRSGGLNVGGGL